MRLAALDTKFILALAVGESDAEATLNYLKQNRIYPIITESVIEQLGEIKRDRTDPASDSAFYALWMFPGWGIGDPPNPHVQNGTSCLHAESLIKQGVIPGARKIESELLVEAACHECELLITFSPALLGAPPVPLNLALIENELCMVAIAIASPQMIADRLKQTAMVNHLAGEI